MAEISSEIKELIHKFIDELEATNIHVQKAVLFGSYARGTNDKWSDIDLAIVSDNFVGNRYYDNEKIRKAKFAVSYELEPLTYRPEEFNESNPFVREILRHGINVI
ncbi:MAG: nucleotidyltransferase [Ignavibacteria bacterium GWB2_35_12]|nr:MAG: nucleotidyltransferase [Ignavibacteria bacterium GWA2_35_8]OGU42424.1 MAG: nucleotidyltransferase [Ignavibacteria bacterium GWB2_35_12]OGU96593.1 MAG: nucleotidyltransferase [Ignavibacteria bacterium RIFOXYA2_FULL_35_10]OGV24204.1 MAG: nucleotidyltransferase [Ignavibacteria bacterium RIFOXYC2_FULL_35_21]